MVLLFFVLIGTGVPEQCASNGFHWILIVVFCFYFLSPSRRDCVVFFGGGGS